MRSDVVSKISTVLDKMGVVSAKAQGLPVAITSATKLRNTDHVVYILTDPEGNKYVHFLNNLAHSIVSCMFYMNVFCLGDMEQLLGY